MLSSYNKLGYYAEANKVDGLIRSKLMMLQQVALAPEKMQICNMTQHPI